MPSLAEQLAALPVIETLETGANPGTFTILPWATASEGSWIGSVWRPTSYVLTEEPATRSGIYYNAAEHGGGRAAVGFQYVSGVLTNADRRLGCWLFTAAGANPSGYQLQWDTISSGTLLLWRLTRWVEGVGTVLDEWEESYAATDVYFLSAFDGTVAGWRQAKGEGLPTVMGEAKDSTFTSGRAGLDGNGSNPSIVDFVFGTLETPSAPAPPPASFLGRRQEKLRVVSIAEGGEGRGYDLSDEVEGLRWSSVNPGGDETCSFTVPRSWFADNPEIAKGNLLRVMSGVDVLWQGRIEEHDRGGDETESIQVTAVGLGARLKDGTFRTLFVSRDLSVFVEASTQRKINLNAEKDLTKSSWTINGADAGVTGTALLITLADGTASQNERQDVWAYFGGVDLAEARYDFIAPKPGGLGEALNNRMLFSTDDIGTAVEGGTIHHTTAEANQVVKAPGPGYKYLYVFMENTNAAWVGPSTGDTWGYSNWRVFGLTGLTTKGSGNRDGFSVDQMVGYIVEQVSGVLVRRLDSQSYVVLQASYLDSISHNDAIVDLNKYEGCDWGTWGPDSPLDPSVAGYFDFASRDPSTQHWLAHRRDAENLDLHSETSTLFSAVDVSYETSDGIRRVLRRSTAVPDLDAAGLTRVAEYNLGKGEKEDAEAAGDLFLTVWGQFAPARGSLTLKGRCQHHSRGDLPIVYFRADGSNLRIPDILPSTTALALDSTPDKRTTFPVKRVEIDCSGSVPAATVELDQANDTLSILQARTELSQSLLPTA